MERNSYSTDKITEIKETGKELKNQQEDGVAARVTSPSMASYNAAVDNFSKSVTAFMEQMHHLSLARDAYHEAMRASAELRNILDAGDETLRTLMSNLEQAIDAHLGRQVLDKDKKKPERLSLEAIAHNGDNADVAKAAS